MSDLDSNNKYIPLKTAAQLYGYTRDHLGLMIRQNKLKGIKLGSYYVTTAEWATEYIKKYADPNHPVNKNKLSNKFLTEALLNEGEQATLKNKVKSVSVKNFTAKSKMQPRKINFVTSKSINDPPQTDLQAEILKELSRLHVASNEKNTNDGLQSQKNSLSEGGNPPYIILPVRKMNDFERNEILKKISKRDDEENTAEAV